MNKNKVWRKTSRGERVISMAIEENGWLFLWWVQTDRYGVGVLAWQLAATYNYRYYCVIIF